MINVPSLSGLYGYVASLAGSLLIKEEGEAEGCGEGLAFHLSRPTAGSYPALGPAWLIENADVVNLTCSLLVMLWC